ncbi:hypothetical protein KKE75_01545 [Patescibacteria group bacterium]|nr:hypothetical protein [Patescibacteria group bacterium]
MALKFENLPTSVDEDNPFEVKINLIDAPKETVYYFRGVLFEAGKTSYFGYTYNHLGQWHNAPSEPTKFLEITTSPEGSWSGQLKVKADINSSYFKGEGEYEFKVGRYTAAGNFGSWSDNTAAIKIIYTPPPSPSPSPSASPSPAASPFPSPSPSPSPTPIPSKSPSPKPSPSPEESLMPESATPTGEVLGENEASPTAETKKKNPLTLSFILIGLGITLLATTGIVFYNQRHERKI